MRNAALNATAVLCLQTEIFVPETTSCAKPIKTRVSTRKIRGKSRKTSKAMNETCRRNCRQLSLLLKDGESWWG